MSEPPLVATTSAKRSRGIFLLRSVGVVALCGSLWLIDLVGVALIGTNLIGRQRQEQLSASVDSLGTLLPEKSSPLPFAATTHPHSGVVIGRLEIPAISLRAAVIEGSSLAQLTYGPGHVSATALPGQAGNAVVAGHRTTWGKPFARLQELQPGNRIVFENGAGRATYVVTTSKVVSPNDASVLQPTSANVVTLITCTPPHFATHRLVIRAHLAGTTPRGPVGARPPEAPVAIAMPTTSPWLIIAGLAGLCGGLFLALTGRNVGRNRRWRNVSVVSCLVVSFTFINVALVDQLPAGF